MNNKIFKETLFKSLQNHWFTYFWGYLKKKTELTSSTPVSPHLPPVRSSDTSERIQQSQNTPPAYPAEHTSETVQCCMYTANDYNNVIANS